MTFALRDGESGDSYAWELVRINRESEPDHMSQRIQQMKVRDNRRLPNVHQAWS